jgi:hypothetical protein
MIEKNLEIELKFINARLDSLETQMRFAIDTLLKHNQFFFNLMAKEDFEEAKRNNEDDEYNRPVDKQTKKQIKVISRKKRKAPNYEEEEIKE